MIVSLIKFLIDPFNILLLLILATFIAWLIKKDRLFKWLVISLLIWFLGISTPFVPTVVLNSLEDQYSPVVTSDLADISANYHIIVLGGGHGFDEHLPANALLSSRALGRLSEAIRLHRALPNSNLVLSGSTSMPGRTTQAVMLQRAALLLGVEEEAIILQKEPKNTLEEAEAYAKRFGSRYPLIVVASASQMPRAMLAFRNFGIHPLPSPANYRLKGSWKRKWFGLPAIDNMENLRIGIYEYIGIFWYRLQDNR